MGGVGSSMMALANFGGPVSLSMSTQVVGEPTLCPGASKKGSVPASLRAKGMTPVKGERMQPVLNRFPDRGLGRVYTCRVHWQWFHH